MGYKRTVHTPCQWELDVIQRLNVALETTKTSRTDVFRQLKTMGVGKAYSTVHATLSGVSAGSFQTMAHIAKIVGISLDELAWGTVNPLETLTEDERVLFRIYRHQVAKNGLTLEDAIDALTRK